MAGTIRKYLKKLVLLYAASYLWGMLKEKIWKKGKKKGKKEVEIN